MGTQEMKEVKRPVTLVDWDGVSTPIDDLPQTEDRDEIKLNVPKGFSKIEFAESQQVVGLYRERSPRGFKIVVYTNFQKVYSRYLNTDNNTATDWHSYPELSNITSNDFNQIVNRGSKGLCNGHGELYWANQGE